MKTEEIREGILKGDAEAIREFDSIVNGLNFTGTQQYYRWSKLFPWFLLTDGTAFVYTVTQCGWFFDHIIDFLVNDRENEDYFVFSITRLENNDWLFKVEDGNYNIFHSATVSGEFPLKEFEVWQGTTCFPKRDKPWEMGPLYNVVYLRSEH